MGCRFKKENPTEDTCRMGTARDGGVQRPEGPGQDKDGLSGELPGSRVPACHSILAGWCHPWGPAGSPLPPSSWQGSCGGHVHVNPGSLDRMRQKQSYNSHSVEKLVRETQPFPGKAKSCPRGFQDVMRTLHIF